MDIKHTVETEDGDVEFQARLSGQELQAVLTVGLNTLIRMGAMPLLDEDRPMASIGPASRQQ